MVREGQGVAVEVMTRSGLDLSFVRASVLEMLDRADVAPESRDEVTIVAVRWSICGTASPECGALFVRSGGSTMSHVISRAFALPLRAAKRSAELRARNFVRR